MFKNIAYSCLALVLFLLPQAASFGTSLAYVVNYSGPSISLCQLNPDGTINGACGTSDAGGTLVGHFPANIVLNPARTFAYITLFDNWTGTSIVICPVNPDGTLGSTCTTTTGQGTFDQPNGIAINPCGSVLYVANGGNPTSDTDLSSISSCRIRNDGSLGHCTINSPVGPFGSNGIALNYSNRLAFIANYYSAPSSETGLGAITICPIQANGTLDTASCIQNLAGGTLSNPIDIKLNAANTFSYITNLSNNTLSICPVIAGSLGAICSTSTGNGTINGPADMFIDSTNQSLYIANNNNNTVSLCPLQSNGLLGTCTALTDASFNTPNDVFVSHF